MPHTSAPSRAVAAFTGFVLAHRRPTLLYLLSRLWSTLLLEGMFALAQHEHWAFASPRQHADLFTFSGSWDGSSYREIAEHGYPSPLPVLDDGRVAPSVWAFFPLYPFLVRGAMAVTGGAFYPLAAVVSALLGLVACVALWRVMREREETVDPAGRCVAADWAVIVLAFGPLGFLLQAAYAESLFLALYFAALLAMMRRRYAWAALWGVLAAFARPGALALALGLALIAMVRWWDRRRGVPGPRTEPLRALVSGVVVALAGLAWPVIAWAATGRADAYAATEAAFRAPFIGDHPIVPLTPWFVLGIHFLGAWWGVIATLVVVAACAWWFADRRFRALPLEPRLVSLAYALSLFAVFLPQQSTPRILMPLAPMVADRRLLPRRRGTRIVVAVALALLQAVAVVGLWFLAFP